MSPHRPSLLLQLPGHPDNFAQEQLCQSTQFSNLDEAWTSLQIFWQHLIHLHKILPRLGTDQCHLTVQEVLTWQRTALSGLDSWLAAYMAFLLEIETSPEPLSARTKQAICLLEAQHVSAK